MSNYKDIDKDIEKMIEKELKSANEKFPQFASEHEGWAILKEEIEEADVHMSLMKTFLQNMWTGIRLGEPVSADATRNHAVALISEAVQIAAMCDKFDKLLESTHD